MGCAGVVALWAMACDGKSEVAETRCDKQRCSEDRKRFMSHLAIERERVNRF